MIEKIAKFLVNEGNQLIKGVVGATFLADRMEEIAN